MAPRAGGPMTWPTRIQLADRPAGRVLVWQHDRNQHDRQLYEGARRQREHREALVARRDDDDSDAA
jgi:hypothetical protein